MRRRRDYKSRCWQVDYFVVHHLQKILEQELTAVVAHGTRIADIGCGEQPWRSLIEQCGGRYVGVDISINKLCSVQVLGEIVALPLRTESVDVALCTEVMEHVLDVRQGLLELARIVKPGGQVLLTTPFCYPLHEEPHDYGRLTSYQLAQLASTAGLELRRLEITGNELEVLATVWSHLWIRRETGEPGLAGRICGLLMRLPVNLLTLCGSALFCTKLPRKSYLNNVCILQKPMRENG